MSCSLSCLCHPCLLACSACALRLHIQHVQDGTRQGDTQDFDPHQCRRGSRCSPCLQTHDAQRLCRSAPKTQVKDSLHRHRRVAGISCDLLNQDALHFCIYILKDITLPYHTSKIMQCRPSHKQTEHRHRKVPATMSCKSQDKHPFSPPALISSKTPSVR